MTRTFPRRVVRLALLVAIAGSVMAAVQIQPAGSIQARPPASMQAQSSSTFVSPLVYGYQADPGLFTYNGIYYLSVDDTAGAPGFDRMRTSSSLAGLASASDEVLWSQSGNQESCYYTLHWGSAWYQYCGSPLDGAHVFVLQSSGDDPMGSYSVVKTNLDATGPDMSQPPFSGGEMFSEIPMAVGSQLYLIAMVQGQVVNGPYVHALLIADASDPYTVSGPWRPLAIPEYGGWDCSGGNRACIDEGASALVHGSKVFLLFSAGSYASPTYCAGMLTADLGSDLTQMSSWTKSSDCVVSSNPAAGVYGPGSIGWFKSPDGTQDWVSYHVKSTSSDDAVGEDRRLEAQQVTWDANGDPVFGQPYALYTPQALPSGDPGMAQTAPALSSWGADRLTLHALGSDGGIWESWWSSETGWSSWHPVGTPPTNGAALGPAAASRTVDYIDDFVPANSDLFSQYWNGSTWTGAYEFGSPQGCFAQQVAASRPSVSTWSSDQLSIFILGFDSNDNCASEVHQSVWQRSWTAETGWGAYQSLGAPSTTDGARVGAIGSPAAYSRASSYIDVFVRGLDGNLYTKYWNRSSWNGWYAFGPGSPPSGVSSSPALASWGADNLQLYVRGRDGHIYQNVWDGSNWSPTWADIGAPAVGAVSDPAAFSRTANVIDLFVRGADDNLYHNYWLNGAWSGWAPFGTP